MEVLCPNTELKLDLLKSVLKKTDSWCETRAMRLNISELTKKKVKPSVFNINGTARSLSKFKVIRHLKFLLYASNE